MSNREAEINRIVKEAQMVLRHIGRLLSNDEEINFKVNVSTTGSSFGWEGVTKKEKVR